MEAQWGQTAPIEDAIVLAGGKGTRLRAAVSGVPKPLAPIGGTPFLSYLLRWLEKGGVRRTVLSIGHMGSQIVAAVGDSFGRMSIAYSAEDEDAPLGTGGAARRAMAMCSAPHVILMNGDTFFDASL
ncbi:MAG: NTP transferase domain-containing protein, partial [Clostridiales bacterium]|nr:NTP transferase domain-containing protein [Clostridiales bacterium]